MPEEKYATYGEITSQPEAWAQALDVTRRAALPRTDVGSVLFTGCGSTYYLSLAAAALYQELTGRAARAVPAGELLLYPKLSLTDESTMLVAISRSGSTTETVKAVEAFKSARDEHVVVISNYDEALSNLADTAIVIPRGQEKSVAQTRSFASMYVAAVAFAARMSGRDNLLSAMERLPDIGSRLITKYESFTHEVGGQLAFDRFYFLGSGTRYGLACEASLKMKEMTLTHSEPFHFLEFRHGPMSMLNPSAVVIGLLSESQFKYEQAVLSEMQALGGKVVALGEAQADIVFASGLPECLRGVLYLPALQLMAFHRSQAKGLNPDLPKNLEAVITLDL